ncbi:MAG: tRNA-dihydrouridine synthase [Candidatus Anammoxibacter sp.]
MKPVLYMAPIQGITNCVYRNVYSRLFGGGYDFAIAPFTRNCNATSTKCKVLRDIFVQRNSTDFELIPQILSRNAGDFINLAKIMFEMGYKTVNWNLGCPHIRVRRKKKGSGLLSEPDTVVKILEEVITAIPYQISLKVRLGNEDNNELFKLLPLLNDFALKKIIIHPRIGSQMYSGVADISAFEKCLSLTRHPVVYNGDIDSVDTYRRLAERFPTVNMWMIGRGGIVNPFLPEQIKNSTNNAVNNTQEKFVEFHNELFATYENELSGPAHLIAKMKEMWRYWSEAFEGGNRVLHSLSRTKNVNQYVSMVEKFFCDKPKLLI